MSRPRRSWGEVLTRRFLEQQIEAGRSVAEIAADVGCAPNTVRSYLTAHGLRPVPPGVIAAAPAATLRSEYERLGGIEALAARHRVSFSTARRWLLEAQIELRPPSRPRVTSRGVDVAQAAERYRAGEALAAISADLGISASTLRDHLVAAGVPTRRPGRRRRVDGGA